MTYPLLIVICMVVAVLSVTAFHKPHLLLTSGAFPFTRKCLGVCIFSYAISLISLSCMVWDAEGWLVFAIVMQMIAWMFMVFVVRGMFEVLASDGYPKKK